MSYPPVSDQMFDETYRLLAASLSGQISSADCHRLNELVRRDAEARSLYLKLVFESSIMLTWAGNAEPAATHEAIPASPVFVPVLDMPANRGATSYLLSGWPVAYFVATVICILGAIVAGRRSVCHTEDRGAAQPTTIAKQECGGTSQLQFVGRITALVDCQWSDPNTAVSGPVAVPLGRKYALSAGLVEITYDTGAKVILQGPCTYDVDSTAGGYLTVGKLVARVERKGESANKQSSNPKSNIPSLSRLFTVTTPTARVTDLGTEFGVEVDNRANTTSHVFRGSVELRTVPASTATNAVSHVMHENQSARVTVTDGGDSLAVHDVVVDPATFVRAEQLPKLSEASRFKQLRRWQAHSRQMQSDPGLVAYYVFAPDGDGSTRTLPNLSATGSEMDGQVEGAEWVVGRMPGKYALYFHGPGSGDRVVLPDQDRFKFTGPFAIAVWFRTNRFGGKWQALVVKGQDSWRLQQNEADNSLAFDTTWESSQSEDVCLHKTAGRTNVADGRWHLAVATYETIQGSARTRLYLDGRLDAEGQSPVPLRQNNEPVLLGALSTIGGREFQGLIDEVAIFARSLSADEIAAMYKAGGPANSLLKTPNKDNEGPPLNR